MIAKPIPLGLLVLLLAPTTAIAQNKISGTAQFGKPDPQHVVPVTGMPNHSLGVEQFKGTWTKPMILAGVETKDCVNTATDDITGNMGRTRGYHVTTMANGDTLRVSYSGSETLKDGGVETTKGSWAFTGGTGKLKGVKGKGTYDCKADGEGLLCDVEGEYALPK